MKASSLRSCSAVFLLVSVLRVTAAEPPPAEMYRVTFRLLETADEHFRKYHWPMHAWALPDEGLRKIYRDNAVKLLQAQR